MGRLERLNPKSWRTSNGGGLPGGTDLMDKYGRILQRGDVVLREETGSLPWRVVDIRPNLHPQAQAGEQIIVLVSDARASIPGGVKVSDFIKIQDASELPAMPPLPGEAPATAQEPQP